MIRSAYLKPVTIFSRSNIPNLEFFISTPFCFTTFPELKLFKIANRNICSLYKLHQSKIGAQGYEKNCLKIPPTGYYSCRHIWGWLNSIFNRVDEQRILDAGPDRACAEWLLRCGAGVKWLNSDRFLKDYNSLPVTGARLLKIEEVDATDSAVMHIGFPHFKGCKHIRRVVLHRAIYVDDEALEQLRHLRKSLRELQVSSCGDVSREGLNHLKILSKLEYLLFYDLPRIQDKEEVIKEFSEALPNCTVSFPYAQASERPQEEEAT